MNEEEMISYYSYELDAFSAVDCIFHLHNDENICLDPLARDSLGFPVAQTTREDNPESKEGLQLSNA